VILYFVGIRFISFIGVLVKRLFEKLGSGLQKELILYLFFGGCTTLIRIFSYYLFYSLLSCSNVVANIFSWLFSVAFAFVTNRKYVFNSSTNGKAVVKEMLSFVLSRIGTGVLELFLMYILVDLLSYPAMWMKCGVTVLVIILNYILSKIVVFVKKN